MITTWAFWLIDFELLMLDFGFVQGNFCNPKSKIPNLKSNHSCGTAPESDWIFPAMLQFTGALVS
jgi:hypothetical protein